MTPDRMQRFLFGIEYESSLQVCNAYDHKKPIYRDYKDDHEFLFQVSTEISDGCYDLEGQLGVFDVFGQEQFTRCCKSMKDFFECASTEPNVKCDGVTGKPQLTMSFDISLFPAIFFIHHIQFTGIQYIELFHKSLRHVLMTFEAGYLYESIDGFCKYLMDSKDIRINFRDEIKKLNMIIFDAISERETPAMYNELMSYWGFIVYVNMFMMRYELMQHEYSTFKTLHPSKTVQDFNEKNYFKSFFHLKPRTKVNFLYLSLSEKLKRLIDANKDLFDFTDFSKYYKKRDFIRSSSLSFSSDLMKDLPHDIFEFDHSQNIPYEVTVEFRNFSDLYYACGSVDKVAEFLSVDEVETITLYILDFFKDLVDEESITPLRKHLVKSNPSKADRIDCPKSAFKSKRKARKKRSRRINI